MSNFYQFLLNTYAKCPIFHGRKHNFLRLIPVGFVWKCWVNTPNEIAMFHDGIMISKTIGYNGVLTIFRHTHIINGNLGLYMDYIYGLTLVIMLLIYQPSGRSSGSKPSCAQPHIPSTPFASLRLHCAGDSACVRLRAADFEPWRNRWAQNSTTWQKQIDR